MISQLVKVDPEVMEEHQVEIATALTLIAEAKLLLAFKTNTGFIHARGRVTLAVDKLKQAEDCLGRAQLPF